MKVLWTSAVEFPELCEILNKKNNMFGGWLNSCAEALRIEDPSLQLGIITCKKDGKWNKIEAKNTYYQVACKSHTDYSEQLVKDMIDIISDFKPDLIHINGTEHCIGLAITRAATNTPVVASIQGLAFVYKKYVDGEIPIQTIIRHFSLRDLLGQSGIWYQKRIMRERGKYEVTLLKELHHVIGRTTWDFAHTAKINPNINYHFCNETLRSSFYKHKWDYQSCEKHHIFISNGSTPLKGAHIVLDALKIVKKSYPDVSLSIIGPDFRSATNLKEKLHLSGYQKYMTKLIKQYELDEQVRFLGFLDEEKMCNEFLKAHVYILPSCIENSPNSLGEAQLLGVPAIATFVGGVPSMVEDGKSGLLYRYDDAAYLANRIMNIFSMNDYDTLSSNERAVAQHRHNKKGNALTMLNIYNEIINKHHDN